MTIRRKNSSSIRYGEELIEYEIHHRPAVTRRIHLELDEGGSLKVVAPRRMSRRAIRQEYPAAKSLPRCPFSHRSAVAAAGVTGAALCKR
jgi:hypothetical protein